MNKILFIFLILSFLTSCENNSTDKKENLPPQKQENKLSSILGKWQFTDGNPILEGKYISEYLSNNTFQQNGVISSFQPIYTCQSTANGTYSITNGILTYTYLAQKMQDCQPTEYQFMVDSYMRNNLLKTGQSKIISLDEKTMIQEDLATKKRLTFTRVLK